MQADVRRARDVAAAARALTAETAMYAACAVQSAERAQHASQLRTLEGHATVQLDTLRSEAAHSADMMQIRLEQLAISERSTDALFAQTGRLTTRLRSAEWEVHEVREREKVLELRERWLEPHERPISADYHAKLWAAYKARTRADDRCGASQCSVTAPLNASPGHSIVASRDCSLAARRLSPAALEPESQL
jgi:hypothetical protein